MLSGCDCYIAASTKLAQYWGEFLEAATRMQQHWEEGSEVWQNVSKGMERLKWNINSQSIWEKISEGEGSYFLQTLETDTDNDNRFFFSFVIQKNICKKNEVGKWKEKINKCT